MNESDIMSPSVQKLIMESKPYSDNHSFMSQPKQVTEEQQIEIATKVLQEIAELMHRNGWSVASTFDQD